MVFSSNEFLFFFMPVTIMLYCIVPRKARNLLILAASLFFYGWGEPKYILIMLFSTVFDYSNGRLLERYDHNEKVRKTILILSISVNLGILGFFKYTDFAVENINRLFDSGIGQLQLALPIGISFYTFQTLSYTIDVYRRKVRANHNILDFGMYICMFPQLIAGPIVRYTDIENQLRGREESTAKIWKGLFRFSVGLGKKVLLANQIGLLWTEISQIDNVSMLTAWVGAAAFTFQIYFDFSGYSDMAIGLGMIFGFNLPENFNYPYESKSATEFWRRWHMTLGTWFREYLYIPLGGNRCGKGRQIFNLLVVWTLTGLWHGASWNFVIWGLYYFVILVLEKIFIGTKLEKLPKKVQHIYGLLVISFGWCIFAIEDMEHLGNYIGSLLGVHGFFDPASLYYIGQYGLMMIILAVGSTSAISAMGKALVKKTGADQSKYFVIAEFILIVLLMAMSTIFLIGDSYNPFLYFRF